jgi:hypothetical protein
MLFERFQLRPIPENGYLCNVSYTSWYHLMHDPTQRTALVHQFERRHHLIFHIYHGLINDQDTTSSLNLDLYHIGPIKMSDHYTSTITGYQKALCLDNQLYGQDQFYSVLLQFFTRYFHPCPPWLDPIEPMLRVMNTFTKGNTTLCHFANYHTLLPFFTFIRRHYKRHPLFDKHALDYIYRFLGHARKRKQLA